jgi:hypothetical protein
VTWYVSREDVGGGAAARRLRHRLPRTEDRMDGAGEGAGLQVRSLVAVARPRAPPPVATRQAACHREPPASQRAQQVTHESEESESEECEQRGRATRPANRPTN